jgi:MFS family permease
MIAGTYLLSAVLAGVLAVLIRGHHLTTTSFMVVLCVLFFVASAGASSAYLTVSEIFPMETRALAIAFFFAIGTGAGGIVGPLLFGNLIKSGSVAQLADGFWLGAGVMALGGLAALFFAVAAERKPLEEVARPLTAEEADEIEGDDERGGRFERTPHTAPATP